MPHGQVQVQEQPLHPSALAVWRRQRLWQRRGRVQHHLLRYTNEHAPIWKSESLLFFTCDTSVVFQLEPARLISTRVPAVAASLFHGHVTWMTTAAIAPMNLLPAVGQLILTIYSSSGVISLLVVCRGPFWEATCLNIPFCPQPTPHVSPSPSSPATTGAASTLTGAVIMVSVCSLTSPLLSISVYSGNSSLPLLHSFLCMYCHQPHIVPHASFLSPCTLVFFSSVLPPALLSVLLFCVVGFAACCAGRPLCCLPLILSFRKGLWGRLWWVELSKPARLVHRSTCTTAAMTLV